MRRILVDAARKKKRTRHGGGRRRIPLPDEVPAEPDPAADLLAVDGVVDALAAHDPAAADLVKLHVFAGLTIEKAAALLGVSARTAYRTWAYARAWMFRRLDGPPGDGPESGK
jgi:RNA polymerase sigma factor (TIGR02999 family)